MIGLGLVLLRYVEVSLFHSCQLNISAFRVLRATIECDAFAGRVMINGGGVF